MRDGRTWRIQQHLLECGATIRVRGTWPGRVNPLSSRNHQAKAIPEARFTKISSCAVAASSNDVAGQAGYLGPPRARDIRSRPERACMCIKATSTAILARCDTHLRPPGQDSWSGRLQMSRACWSGACRGSKSAWSARNARNHVGRGLGLPLPPQDTPQVVSQSPPARSAAGPPEGRLRCPSNASRGPSRC
jgi:hypothetical protein